MNPFKKHKTIEEIMEGCYLDQQNQDIINLKRTTESLRERIKTLETIVEYPSPFKKGDVVEWEGNKVVIFELHHYFDCDDKHEYNTPKYEYNAIGIGTGKIYLNISEPNVKK